jgi:hypothetical protein
MNVDIIKTYTGYARSSGRIKSTVAYAYRCRVCELIMLTKKEATPHLKCKGA